MKKEMVFIVIELSDHDKDPPKIIGVYRNRADAHKAAYADANAWRNIIEQEVK